MVILLGRSVKTVNSTRRCVTDEAQQIHSQPSFGDLNATSTWQRGMTGGGGTASDLAVLLQHRNHRHLPVPPLTQTVSLARSLPQKTMTHSTWFMHVLVLTIPPARQVRHGEARRLSRA